jgi:CRISPR/Cas system CMR-associated protein Cmr1 (group 7 of RAMP superfamily)
MNIVLQISLLTPLFSRGAYEGLAEIRPPSIRGQIHWWFRALGGTIADERALFGGIANKGKGWRDCASKVVVRVSDIQGQTGQLPTLPHKSGGQAAIKIAYLPGTRFKLHVFTRFGGLNQRHEFQCLRALEMWLLLGTLGLRSTRAGGSFEWQPMAACPLAKPPVSVEEFSQRVCALIQDSPLRFDVLSKNYGNHAEEARRDVSNTIGGRDDKQGKSDLLKIQYPLGMIEKGSRKTSPLRFKIYRFADGFRVIAIWDGRKNVTGNQLSDLLTVIEMMKSKPIGQQLANSQLARQTL